MIKKVSTPSLKWVALIVSEVIDNEKLIITNINVNEKAISIAPLFFFKKAETKIEQCQLKQ
jgi:hypothetical protein